MMRIQISLRINFRKQVGETDPSAVLLHLLPAPDTCYGKHHQLDPENLNDIRQGNTVVTTFILDSVSLIKPCHPVWMRSEKGARQ